MAWNGMEAVDTNKPYSYYRPFLVADLGVSVHGNSNTQPDKYPKPGYQNAPAFCENTDKSMGTYSFEVPKDKLKPGCKLPKCMNRLSSKTFTVSPNKI